MIEFIQKTPIGYKLGFCLVAGWILSWFLGVGIGSFLNWIGLL